MATATTPSGAVVDTGSGALISGPTNSNAGAPAGGSTGTTGDSSNPTDSALMDQIQQRLLSQSDVISSQSTGVENQIGSIIGGIQTGEQQSEQATTLNYNAQEVQAQAAGQQTLTSTEEAQRGYATNYAALQRIQDTTTKNVASLETQKQQLILQGESTAAQTISGLQVQALQFQQQAQQQVFTNLLNLAQYGQAQQAAQQSQAAQSFSEQQAISSIALQYGLQVQPGDTINSITTRAAPLATQQEQNALNLQKAQINEANANAAQSLAAANSGGALTQTDIQGLASAYLSPLGGSGVLANVKNPSDVAAIVAEASSQLTDYVGNYASTSISQGVPLNTALNNISNDTTVSGKQFGMQAQQIVTAAYAAATPNVSPATSGAGFQAPGTLPSGGLSAIKSPVTTVTAAQHTAALNALQKALQGTAFTH